MTAYCACAACKDALAQGDYQNVETAPMSQREYDLDFVYLPWELTPKWHPYRWLFRCDLRQRVRDTMGGGEFFWVYGRSHKVAHDLLRRAYATDVSESEIK